jgi:monoamine oxidase
VELGAEFIQGRPKRLLEVINRAGLAVHQVPERHERARGHNRRQLADVEGLVERLLEPTAELEDMPVEQLIRERANRFNSEELDAMTGYLEGFHAADLSRFGTLALAENQKAEAEDADSVARMVGGYGQLVTQLAAGLNPDSADVRTSTVVTALRWGPGKVLVEARTEGQDVRVSAAQAILAVPLNTLKVAPNQHGTFFPDPAPDGWRHALECLEVGPVQHIVLRFEHPWWDKPGRPPVFLHGRGEHFPVWWTSSPPRAPFITGWAGGPRALRLAGKTVKQLVPLALLSAAKVFGVPAEQLARDVRAAYSHDWTSDPFTRGGYSYGGVGALGARELLRKPICGTLVLSGEALADEGRNATVPGALTSGLSAAEKLLA